MTRHILAPLLFAAIVASGTLIALYNLTGLGARALALVIG